LSVHPIITPSFGTSFSIKKAFVSKANSSQDMNEISSSDPAAHQSLNTRKSLPEFIRWAWQDIPLARYLFRRVPHTGYRLDPDCFLPPLDSTSGITNSWDDYLFCWEPELVEEVTSIFKRKFDCLHSSQRNVQKVFFSAIKALELEAEARQTPLLDRERWEKRMQPNSGIVFQTWLQGMTYDAERVPMPVGVLALVRSRGYLLRSGRLSDIQSFFFAVRCAEEYYGLADE
jgi:hypothetical protein